MKLTEVAELSYSTRSGICDNRLIHGDNLLALKALEQEFAGKVKCIYIDPPYNTGGKFEHYDDGLEHSLWLDLMTKRIEVMRALLREDGVLFVHLDQEEVHYLKVILDELFGRPQFLGQIAYERSGVSGIGQGGAFLVNTHEYILAYSKDRSKFAAADLQGEGELEPQAMKRYNRVLVSPGHRTEVARFVAPSTGEPVVIYRHSGVESRTISLRDFENRRTEIEGEYAANFEHVFRLTSIQKENEFQNRILSYCKDGFFSADYLVSRGKKEGERTTSYYIDGQAAVWLRDTASLVDGKVVRTGKQSDFWIHADIPKANLANEGGVDFRRGKKPEHLIRRLLKLVTVPGDLVLDSFLGSGTTAAVAHKMGRRWIGVERGEHAITHCIPRLRRVAAGEDPSGITSAVDWKGGGGFRFFRVDQMNTTNISSTAPVSTDIALHRSPDTVPTHQTTGTVCVRTCPTLSQVRTDSAAEVDAFLLDLGEDAFAAMEAADAAVEERRKEAKTAEDADWIYGLENEELVVGIVEQRTTQTQRTTGEVRLRFIPIAPKQKGSDTR